MSNVEVFEADVQMSVEEDETSAQQLLQVRGIGDCQGIMTEEDLHGGIGDLSNQLRHHLDFFLHEISLRYSAVEKSVQLTLLTCPLILNGRPSPGLAHMSTLTKEYVSPSAVRRVDW